MNHVLLLFFLFVLFCFIFRLGSTAIYSILDWSKPGSTTLVCVGTLIFMVLLHIFMYGMYRLRVYLMEMWKKKEQKASQTEKGVTNVGFVPESA